MSLVINTKTYTADSFGTNAMGYAGPGASVTAKDFLALTRVSPKVSAEFSGVGRTSAKLTRTLTLTGAKTPTADIIVEVRVSAPVGASSADIDVALNDMASFVGSASFKLQAKNLQISF